MNKTTIAVRISEHSKKIGTFDGETLVCDRKKSKHFMRIYGGSWAVDSSKFNELMEKGLVNIIIHDSEEHKSWIASSDTFIKVGFVRNFGHGDQIFLPLKYWMEIPYGGKYK